MIACLWNLTRWQQCTRKDEQIISNTYFVALKLGDGTPYRLVNSDDGHNIAFWGHNCMFMTCLVTKAMHTPVIAANFPNDKKTNRYNNMRPSTKTLLKNPYLMMLQVFGEKYRLALTYVMCIAMKVTTWWFFSFRRGWRIPRLWVYRH